MKQSNLVVHPEQTISLSQIGHSITHMNYVTEIELAYDPADFAALVMDRKLDAHPEFAPWYDAWCDYERQGRYNQFALCVARMAHYQSWFAAKHTPAAQEGKYGQITSTGKQFHPGEPIFILRATDPLAPLAIEDYACRCEQADCDLSHIDAVRHHKDRIAEWQYLNPKLVKAKPD